MIQAVVWDIGRVLIEWNPEAYYDRLIGPEQRRRMFSKVDLHAYNLRVDAGAPLRATFEEAARQAPEFADPILHWVTHWIRLASPQIPGSVHLLQALKTKSVPVLALTNFGVETFEIARAHYPFLDLFDRRYVSGHLKTVKPAPPPHLRDTGAGQRLRPGTLAFHG